MTSTTRRPAPSPQPDAYTRMRTTHPRLFDNPVHGIVILDDDQAADAAAAAEARGQTAQALRQVGVVYSDPYITLLRDPVRLPDGQLGLYLRVVHPGPPGVAILPITDDGHVFLVEHYRHATRSWHWEIPRGFGEGDAFVDVATSTINTAMRELGEEIGASARELLPLGTLHPDTGILAGSVHLFAAVVDSTGDLEAHEAIRRVVKIPFREAEDRVRTQAVTCGFTIAALYRARLRGLIAP